MKIYPNITTTFRGATLNINAFSDTHGCLKNIGAFYDTIEDNKEDLFLKEEKSAKNITAIAGDWYMAGNVRGYLSNPQYNSQRFQLLFFNKLIKEMKKMCPNNQAIFSIGNHEFDAGFDEFEQCIKKMNATIVSTNLDFENSKESLKDEILKSYTIEIPDDKVPNLSHKALFLGIAPANMPYYQKKLTQIKFLDSATKPQSELEYEDFKDTIKTVKEEIEKFKDENPKGAVILLDHFGGNFQRELLDKKLPINLILNAHEHNDFNKLVGNTYIISLYQNFEKLENIKIKFDDSGEINSIQSRALYPQKSQKTGLMQKFYNRIFRKDIEKSFEIPTSDDISELQLKGVRYQNSYLANYITDVILNRIKKQYPDTDFFTINASSIRGGLSTKNGGCVNNLDFLLTLNGAKNEDSTIFISKISGEKLLNIVTNNLIANEKDKNKNPLNHYSGLKIEKTLLLDGIKHNLPKEILIQFLRRTDTGEPLELDGEYKLANIEKAFLKTKNPIEKELYTSKDTIKTDLNAKSEFLRHFYENLDEVQAKEEIRIN